MRFPRFFTARAAVTTMAAAYALWLGVATRAMEVLTPDTAEYADIARSLVRGAGYTMNMVYMHAGLRDGPIRHVPELHGLMQPFLVAPLFAVFGVGAAVVKVPTLLFVALSAVLVFEAGRRLFGTLAGVVSAGVLLSHEWTALLGVGGSDDVGHALFAASGLLAFERFLTTSNRRWCWASGAFIGLAALEKYSGVVLPAVLGAAWLLEGRSRRRLQARDAAAIAGPVLIAYVLYTLRNVASHGTSAFSFTAVDWLAKTDPRLYFGYYETPPATLAVLRDLGPARVLGLVFDQVKLLGVVVYSNPLAYAGGPIALYLCRAQRTFARIAAVYALCMLAVVCIAYHVEIRYLFGLELVFAIAIGGAVSRFAQRWLPRHEIQLAVAALALSAVLAARSSTRLIASFRPADHAKLCADSLTLLRRATRDDSPILTTNPWFVSWVLDRPAVGVPTNGLDPVVTVARHYRTRWALSGADASYFNDYPAALDASSPLRPAPVLVEKHCGVYRLQDIP